MVYHKTHEGRAALRERNALTLRERQLMVLFNGSRTIKELADLFGAAVAADVDRLERRGFIVGRPEGVGFDAQALPPIRREDPELALLARSATSAGDSSQARGAGPTVSRMSLEDFAALANVPALRTASSQVVQIQPAVQEEVVRGPTIGLASKIHSIAVEAPSTLTPVAAQAYVTQVLIALETAAATALVETSGDVRHDVDILLYVAQGIGHTYAVAGEDVALRVAMRASRLLPGKDLPMLLDCTLDYVPNSFSVLLYEFVLAGRETTS